MIYPNPAKVNIPKVSFIVNTFNEVKYNSIYLYGNYSDNRFYNKKIDYVDNLVIQNTKKSVFPLDKKLIISKVNIIDITIYDNLKNINFLLNLTQELKPNYIEVRLGTDCTIPILKLPRFSNIIYLSYSECNCKTIVHCNELFIYINEVIDEDKYNFLHSNLKFLISNFNLFKFKKLTFASMDFESDEIKKILQPYPDIKFYTINNSYLLN